MQIDTEHLHFWMQAIRQSNNPMRTMDAFWSGQLKSKEWLIDKLYQTIGDDPVRIDIHGGWVGTLASLIFQSEINAKFITSVDIDPLCEQVATMMNKKEEINGQFKAITKDMRNVPSRADVIINTSCEHITQSQYETWKDNIPDDCIIVLQSNNYKIPEHIRIATTLDEFKHQSGLQLYYAGELPTQQYTRWMLIGKK